MMGILKGKAKVELTYTRKYRVLKVAPPNMQGLKTVEANDKDYRYMRHNPPFYVAQYRVFLFFWVPISKMFYQEDAITAMDVVKDHVKGIYPE